MRKIIDGRAYSRRLANSSPRGGDPDVLLCSVAGGNHCSVDALLKMCELRACDYLRDAGLPHAPAVKFWRDDHRQWSPMYAWPPVADRRRFEVCSLADLVARAGYKRDSRPDLACRILEKCADVRHALLFKKADEALRLTFLLGVLWQLASVYDAIDASGSKGGNKDRSRPWTAYGAHLVKNNPDATKWAIWRKIPTADMRAFFTVGNVKWTIYRELRDDGENEGLYAEGPESDYSLSRKRFFDEYLFTRKKNNLPR